MRRTGLFEAPSNVVSVQRIASPVGDTAATWEALGKTASILMEKMQPLRDQYAVEQAQRDAADQRYGLRTPFSREDELYNNAMVQSYLLAAERDVDQRVNELEGQYAADAEGFQREFNAVRAGFMANAPDDLAPHLDALLTQRETEGVNRIGERVRNSAISAYAQNAQARLAQMEARLTGYSDPQSPEFQQAFSEYEQTGRALTENPLSGVTTEEWDFRRNNFLSRMTAQSVADQAVRMYQDGGANADSAQAAIAFVEEQMRNPELVLTEAQRDASFAQARRSIMQLETERRRADRELAAQIRSYRADMNNEARDLMAGAEALAQTYTVIPEDQMAELAAAVRESGSPARVREYNELAIENNVRRRLQGLTLPQIEAEMSAYRAQAQEGDADSAVALREAQRYRDNLRRVDGVTGLQLHYGQAPASLEHGLGPRIRQMEAYSTTTGRRETTYFTPGEREQLAGVLRQGGDPALQVLRGLVSEAASEPGNGRVRAQRMLSEVAGSAGPEYSAIGNVLLRGGETSMPTARLMSDALQARTQDGYRRSSYLPQNRQDGAEAQIVARVLGELNMATMGADELNEIRLAADLIYDGRALSDPTVYENSSRYERAYEHAVQAALGGMTRNIGGRNAYFGGVADMGRRVRGNSEFGSRTLENSVVIPNWVRRDQFATIYQSLQLGDFAQAGGGQVPLGGTVGDWRSARLVPTGRAIGEYFLLDQQGARYMVGTGGDRRPYVFNLNQLRASLAERRPDAIAE